MSAALDEAVKRFLASLGQVQAAVGRRLDLEHRRGDLETELQIMQDDRARLATELESTAARLHRLESTTQHVGLRVDRAIGTLHEVIARAEQAQDGE